MLLRGVRLDTGVLASQLGISRATLFRRGGNREAILVDALWHLAELTLRRAERNADRSPDDARLRCLRVMEEFRRVVSGSPAISGLLADEPVLGVRLLTDPRGRLQPRLVDAYVALLQRDVDEHGLTTLVPLPLLAFAVVRLGESFVYADVLAGREVDLDTATTVVDALLTSVLVRP